MNTERLLQLVATIIDDEELFQVQPLLSKFEAALSNLVSSPQEPSYQTSVSSALTKLSNTFDELEKTYTPAFEKRLHEIGAKPFFSSVIVERLTRSLQQNSATLAVALEEARAIVGQREQFISHMRAVISSFRFLGFKEDELGEGEAEIGFQIPRTIFSNNLDGLTKELGELRRIIRTFSEIAGSPGEPIEIHQISTTDPIFWFGLSIITIRLIGQSTTWALDRWKTFEEIRKLRAETANLKGIPGAEDMVAQWDGMITKAIAANVDEKVTELLGPAEARDGRQNELATALEHALLGLIARVERGMTVELRLSPPIVPEEQTPEETENIQIFNDLESIASRLQFPPASQAPSLSLTHSGDASEEKSAT